MPVMMQCPMMMQLRGGARRARRAAAGAGGYGG
eukprot:SAG31_NODE_18181_length_644_cov_1.058716_1_plen_32_part_10